jgi:acetylornithine deacetylase/succinyl-diaminopimelate desuccinylase-like protein
MFVIEEEPGGNGSLDLATDKQVKALYDSVLVLETAGNNIYPANRGAVWFKCDLKRKEPVEQPRYDSSEGSKKELTSNSPSLLEAVIFAVLEMQKEGEAIKSESEHPLFPHKPVQTCNGILGPFGEHPSRICGELSFVLKGTVDEDEYEKIEEAVDRGIADYTARYGDKTQLIDPVTKQKKVDHHYDMSRKDELITIDVHGSAGHMGAILENDDAIVKWAYIAEKLFFLKENGKLDVIMELSGYDSANELTLEGGQGFLPTHTIDTVKERMARAFANGVEHYLSLKNVPLNTFDYMVSYDKLHNDAFDGDPDSPTMVRAWKSGIEAGIIDEQTPKRGWDVSSDARLFAKEYPEMPVITSGVGELTSAHSDNEHVFLPDLFKSIVFTVLFLLRETGSIEE